MEVIQGGWLNVVSRFATVGHIYPGWLLIKPLPGIIEQDQEGHYYISNEGLGLYAVGITQEEAMADFTTSLIDNYQLLEAKASGDPDLHLLFQEYRKYVQIELAGARQRLEGTFYLLRDSQEEPDETGLEDYRRPPRVNLSPSSSPGSLIPETPAALKVREWEDYDPGPGVEYSLVQREAPENPDRLNPDELTLLISLLAEYRAQDIPNRTDLAEIDLLLGKLRGMGRSADR